MRTLVPSENQIGWFPSFESSPTNLYLAALHMAYVIRPTINNSVQKLYRMHLSSLLTVGTPSVLSSVPPIAFTTPLYLFHPHIYRCGQTKMSEAPRG